MIVLHLLVNGGFDLTKKYANNYWMKPQDLETEDTVSCFVKQ